MQQKWPSPSSHIMLSHWLGHFYKEYGVRSKAGLDSEGAGIGGCPLAELLTGDQQALPRRRSK